jgi:hypothetical protein
MAPGCTLTSSIGPCPTFDAVLEVSIKNQVYIGCNAFLYDIRTEIIDHFEKKCWHQNYQLKLEQVRLSEPPFQPTLSF